MLGGAYPGDKYRNQLLANPAAAGRWLKLKLEGVRSNRSAIGAAIKVVVRNEDGTTREIFRTVTSGGSFGAGPLRQEIGLGAARAVERVEIVWPATGETQVVEGLALDRAYAVREGEARAREVAAKAFAWPAADGAGVHRHAHPE